MARIVSAPRASGGGILAHLVSFVIFLLALSWETQHYARLDGYNPRVLGTPVYARYYQPWASIEWMLEYDFWLHPFDGSGKWLIINSNEYPWSRNAFAAERRRLPWEAGAALASFIALSLCRAGIRKNSDLYGSAAWATGRDLGRSRLTKAQYGVVLGQTKRFFGLPGTLLVHSGPQNVLGLGPPGTGKTDGIARPTLTKTWLYWSAIVFDPADELTRVTAKARAQHTRIRIFDPRNPKTSRYNPLGGIKAGDVDAVRSVLSAYFFDHDLTEMSPDNRIFESRGLALATAVVAHVIEIGTPTLEAAAHYVSDPAWKTEGEMCESLLKSEIPYVQETAAEFARMTDRQRSPFMSSLTDRFELFRLPDVARATAVSDISPADLRIQPTTLYLVVREKDQAALNPLMRLVLTRFLHDLIATPKREGESPILLMIDEFPLLRAPIIEQELATIRKHSIHAVLLAQTLSQIRKSYGPNESISGMCDVRVFFPSLDAATQRLASDTCGQVTRWAESTNRDSAGNISHSISEQGRDLLLPHELADMDRTGEIIVYAKGQRAIKARAVHAHRDKRFQ